LIPLPSSSDEKHIMAMIEELKKSLTVLNINENYFPIVKRLNILVMGNMGQG
jgi:hypothetical protein